MTFALRLLSATLLLAGLHLFGAGSAMAQADAWRVGKVSGEAWILGAGVQQASLGGGAELKPGETVRTGRNGRVLLVRGAESMLVNANSQVVVPRSDGSGRTTILQQAGSVLLDVEKRNVQHFEVETPFLAAVVKGTQFRVTVTARGAKVEVQRGQVEVADFRSGQFALVQPGQAANVLGSGTPGLRLSGAGRLNAVQQGAPRAPTVRPVSVPRGGFQAPAAAAREARQGDGGQGDGGAVSVRGGNVRIGRALGEVTIDVGAVTKGLARGTGVNAAAAGGRGQSTVWSNGNSASGNGASAQASRGSGNDAKADSAKAVANANARGNGQGADDVTGRGDPRRPASVGRGSDNGNVGGNGNGNPGSVINGGGNGNGNGGGNGNGNPGGNINAGGNGNGNGIGGGLALGPGAKPGNGTAPGGPAIPNPGNGGGNGNGNAGGNGNGNGNGNGVAGGRGPGR